MNTPLWALYQTTVFAVERRFASSFSFAIVTASNPKGQYLPHQANAIYNQEFEEVLSQQQVVAQLLYACSPDLTHWEQSYALFIDKEHALKLARQFRQNAIFWIEDDSLYLTPCLLQEQSEICPGCFSARLLADVSFDQFQP